VTAVFERSFRIRLYECDAYGHVNHATYLRYMQEAALDASAAVGYDIAWYDAAGRYWLILQTGITYLRPLQYEDTVSVKTWVSDFRRATSRRRYQLRIAGSDELAAEGFSDWVYLDTQSLRPVRVPPHMAEAFTPPGGLPANEGRDPFPEQPPTPEGAYRMRRRTRWSEIDPAGHVNNAAYLTFFEDCAMELMVDRGWPAARMHADGYGIVAREFRIQYQAPALLDDVLEVATWVSQVKRATVLRHYVIQRVSDGELIVRAQALWVWIDLNTGRPLRIPAHYLEAFDNNIISGQ
jgi:acyl-CoA thioester hydrolase